METDWLPLANTNDTEVLKVPGGYLFRVTTKILSDNSWDKYEIFVTVTFVPEKENANV